MDRYEDTLEDIHAPTFFDVSMDDEADVFGLLVDDVGCNID